MLRKVFDVALDFMDGYGSSFIDWILGSILGIAAAYIAVEQGATMQECIKQAAPVVLTYSFLFYLSAFAIAKLLKYLGIDKYLDRGESDGH